MGRVPSNLGEREAILGERRLFIQELLQPVVGDGQKFRSEKCGFGINVGLKSLIGIAGSVLAIESAAQVQVTFMVGEEYLNGVILPKGAQQLPRGVDSPLKPAQLLER